MKPDPIRVLYAEDKSQDADLLRAEFAHTAPEIEIVIATSAAECLRRVTASHFDVLLLDNHLPDQDGLQLLSRIQRQIPSLPIIIVTGSGDEDLVIRALRAGAVEYVSKDATYLEHLPEIIRRVAQRYRELKSAGIPLSLEVCRVLFVEHQPMDVDLAIQHFANEAPHCQLRTAKDGSTALAYLKQAPSDFDVVVSDLRLPDISGLELLRKTRHLGLRVPFILLTGRGDEQMAVAALKLGASDYIVKRENYLTQATYAISHAIQRSQAEARTLELQKALTASNHELAQANENLDAFTHSVAHELKGPLRRISSFAQIAIDDYKSKVDDLTLLQQISSGATRMSALVETLLDFSRLSSKPIHKQTVNLASLAQEVWECLAPDRGEKNYSFEVGSLPTANADRLLIQQVLFNLLTNAIKFSSSQATPRVELGYLEPERAYFVRDNGVGFDDAASKKLFQPFERLHSGEYQGTGVGLVLTKRIVERHDGQIWAEAAPRRGATFYFRL